MGGPIQTPVPTSLPTAVQTPYPVSSAESAAFLPVWLFWLIVVVAVGIMVGLAFVPAGIAKKKGYSYGGFWVFSFFLFIPAIIVAAAIREKNSQPYAQPVQPPCSQPYEQAPQPLVSPAYPPSTCYCTSCGALMRTGGKFCPICGARTE